MIYCDPQSVRNRDRLLSCSCLTQERDEILINQITYIIATYNSATTLKRCLESFVDQKLQNFTVIVVDGGSSDTTISIVEQYPNIVSQCVSEPDSGIYDAFNKGILLAKTPWVSFVGSDDYLTPIATTIFSEVFGQEDTVDYATGAVQLVSANDSIVGLIGEKWSWKSCRKRMLVAHVGSLHNMKLFNDHGLFDTKLKICGDYDFLLRVGRKLRVFHSDKIVASMSVGGVSNSFKAPFESMKVKLNNKSASFFLVILFFLADIFSICRRRLAKIFM